VRWAERYEHAQSGSERSQFAVNSSRPIDHHVRRGPPSQKTRPHFNTRHKPANPAAEGASVADLRTGSGG